MAIETTNELTELNAVNSILGAIGQTPVTTLDLENPETSFVYQLLQECNRDVQDEGWVFNREDCYPLKANAQNQFVIPANVLRMDVSENDIYFTSNVVKRDGKLYDKYRHSFEFNQRLSTLTLSGSYLTVTYPLCSNATSLARLQDVLLLSLSLTLP